LRSVVRGAGGDPDRVRRLTIAPPKSTLDAVADGRVDAAVARSDIEGVTPAADGLTRFRADDFGAPAFPQLVLVTTPETVQDRPEVLRGAIEAMRRGYDEAIRDPELAVTTLLSRSSGFDRAELTAQFRAVAPALRAGGRFGTLDRARLDAWARWAVLNGVVARRPDVGTAVLTGYAE
jgi:ABC-type nitrate/sulfonate/bicarbonate transport system substrate-binding protein